MPIRGLWSRIAIAAHVHLCISRLFRSPHKYFDHDAFERIEKLVLYGFLISHGLAKARRRRRRQREGRCVRGGTVNERPSRASPAPRVSEKNNLSRASAGRKGAEGAESDRKPARLYCAPRLTLSSPNSFHSSIEEAVCDAETGRAKKSRSSQHQARIPAVQRRGPLVPLAIGRQRCVCALVPPCSLRLGRGGGGGGSVAHCPIIIVRVLSLANRLPAQRVPSPDRQTNTPLQPRTATHNGAADIVL